MRVSLSLVVLAASAVCGLVTPVYQPVAEAVNERDGLKDRSTPTKGYSPPKPPQYTPKPPHNPPKPPPHGLPLVSSNALIKSIKTSALFDKAKVLEKIAYDTPKRNRAIGTLGHNNTVKYLENYLSSKSMSQYYNFYKQGFPLAKSDVSSLLLNGVKVAAFAMVDAPGGKLSAPLFLVPNLACNASDFSGLPVGNIAVVLRGTCDRGNKVVLAGQAGAAGVVYRNNAAGANLEDTSLPHDDLPGALIPSVLISLEDGNALATRLTAGEKITASLETSYYNYTTYNVIAETKQGDHNNVLLVCSHSDSVPAGPGINDNGSGSISILETATQLTKFSVKNAVRFSWWTAEEVGLVGAAYYVSQLTQAEKDKIRLVLDYDMMASPNFAYQIYDGDGSAFNNTGPVGSAEAEHEFAKYFDLRGLGHTEIEFDGRSDYGPFLEADIAAGGIACGAEKLKTEEEAKLFGGQAGVAYDINYHSAGDNVANLNATAWSVMTGAIAHTTALYARSWSSIPSRKRSIDAISPDAVEAEKREKIEAEKRALKWVTGTDLRRWTKPNQRA